MNRLIHEESRVLAVRSDWLTCRIVGSGVCDENESVEVEDT